MAFMQKTAASAYYTREFIPNSAFTPLKDTLLPYHAQNAAPHPLAPVHRS